MPPPTRQGPWTILHRRSVYRGPFVELLEDEVRRPDGAPGTYATVRIKPGVTIVARDSDGRVLLVRQFRYALGRDSLEGVCGGLEDDETPLRGARRELREELGVVAECWRSIGSVDLDTSIVTAPAHLFLAEGLTCAGAEPEATERLAPVRLGVREAVDLIATGGITHAATMVLLLRLAAEEAA